MQLSVKYGIHDYLASVSDPQIMGQVLAITLGAQGVVSYTCRANGIIQSILESDCSLLKRYVAPV